MEISREDFLFLIECIKDYFYQYSIVGPHKENACNFVDIMYKRILEDDKIIVIGIKD